MSTPRISKLNFVWRLLQQYSAYLIKMIVQIVLARLLSPEEFGLIAIVLVFVNLAEIIAISGLGTALIRKPDVDEDDYKTALTTSMAISIIIYFILFFASPLVALYYENDQLTLVLRIYGIAIFVQSYAAIQNAYIARNGEFKKSLFGTFIGTLLSGVIAIIFACLGFGIWSLVIQSILAPLFSVLVLHIIVRWKPRIGFSKYRFKNLFSFSWKVLVSSLCGSLLEEMYNLVIGKCYGEKMLGYYKQGNSYPSAIMGQTRTAIISVALPIYSSVQEDKDALKKEISTITHLSVFLIFPMAFGLAAVSESFVVGLLTETWLPCLLFLRLECIFYGLLPISGSLNSALQAKGRSDIGLKIEIGKIIAMVLCIVFLYRVGINAICIARICVSVIALIVSLFISTKLLDYSFLDLIKDIYKPFLISAFMGGSVYALSYLAIRPIFVLLIQVIVGIVIYSMGVLLFMRDDFKKIVGITKTKIS